MKPIEVFILFMNYRGRVEKGARLQSLETLKLASDCSFANH